MGWIWIGCGDNDALNTGGKNGFGARRGASVGATGFERDVEGGAPQGFATGHGGAERFDFSVRSTGAVMAALAYFPSAPNQDGADHRIRRGLPIGTGGEAKSQTHPGLISRGVARHVPVTRRQKTALPKIVWRRRAEDHRVVPPVRRT